MEAGTLFTILSSLVGAILAALVAAVGHLWRRNNELQNANTELAKAGTEALATFTPLLQGINAIINNLSKELSAEQRDAFVRIEAMARQAFDSFEKKLSESNAQIKDHINLLKKID